MNFYDLPTTLPCEIDEFAEALKRFKAGEMHPTKFRAQRVPFGVYEQRTSNTFMLRIRTTAGGITPLQLKKVSELAQQYCKPLVHVTTRQEIQLHDARLEDVPTLLRELLSVGLSSRGGGGNTVRNIMASFDAGINPEELFDVTPHAVALSSRLIGEDDSWNFARKFKISFSGTPSDNALAAFNDLGFIANNRNGRRGFTVYVAGGMGCRPRLSKVLHEFIDEELVYHVCAAVKRLYLDYGNRKTKNSGRLRFLWEELGEKKFRAVYARELEKCRHLEPLKLDLTKYMNLDEKLKKSHITPRPFNSKDFQQWKDQYVVNQSQKGLRGVLLPLPLGDLSARDGIKLSDFLTQFGTNVMRFTMTQNIHLRNIPEAYLGNVYELAHELNTLSHFPSVCGDIIACTGANTCTTGVCLPQGVVPVIQKYLATSELPQEGLAQLRINISGCPNSCGQHHVGDLGLYGRIVRKNGRSLPGYWVTGGASTTPATRAYTVKCGWVAARDLPTLILEILSNYAPLGKTGVSFKDYFHNGGQKRITELCNKYRDNILPWEEDERYYYDWGSLEPFTTSHMGHGECSAGIYDMIEVSMNSINENLGRNLWKLSQDEKAAISRELTYASAGMLLVTRGIDPSSELEVYQAFEEHFLDKGLVDEKFRSLVIASKKSDNAFLREQLPLSQELGKTMIQLYHSMDNRLRFSCETDATKKKSPHLSAKKSAGETVKDLRGVACPMNFVKTKVELARLQIGDHLKIYLDDGEPIDNVPRSVITEGHSILSQEKNNDYWIVVIEKKE